MRKKMNSNLNFMVFLSIILLNFSPYKPLTYPLTIAPFAVLYILRSFCRVREIKVATFVLLLSLPVFVIFKSSSSLLDGSIVTLNFFKTFTLWYFYTVCLILFLFSKMQYKREGAKYSLEKTLVYSLMVTFFVVAAQTIYFRLTGDLNIFSIWGKASYGSQNYLLDSINYGASKANGLYLEPAMLGLVTLSISVAILILRNKLDYIHWFAFVSIALMSGSISIIISLLVLVSILFLKKAPHMSITKNFMYFFYGLLSVFTIIVIAGPYMIDRIASVVVEGSSTYYRFVAPLQILGDILAGQFFGVDFGNMENVLLSYGIINGVSDGQSLDNGWYLLVFYFGWLGLILLVISFFIGLKVILTGARESAILAFFLLLSPFFTGAVFSPEFLFLQMIPLLAYRIKYQNEY